MKLLKLHIWKRQIIIKFLISEELCEMFGEEKNEIRVLFFFVVLLGIIVRCLASKYDLAISE